MVSGSSGDCRGGDGRLLLACMACLSSSSASDMRLAKVLPSWACPPFAVSSPLSEGKEAGGCLVSLAAERLTEVAGKLGLNWKKSVFPKRTDFLGASSVVFAFVRLCGRTAGRCPSVGMACLPGA